MNTEIIETGVDCVESEEFKPLHTTAKRYFITNGWITFLVFFALGLAATVFISITLWTLPDWWMFLAGLAVYLCLGWLLIKWHPEKNFAMTSWRFDEQALLIRRGIFFRKQLAVPRSRVQHIDVAQGPLQRKYDIAELIVHTAGTMNASVSLVGLQHSLAQAIRDRLLEQDDSDAV